MRKAEGGRRRHEAGSRKPEVGVRVLGGGGQKPEVGSQTSDRWPLNSGLGPRSSLASCSLSSSREDYRMGVKLRVRLPGLFWKGAEDWFAVGRGNWLGARNVVNGCLSPGRDGVNCRPV